MCCRWLVHGLAFKDTRHGIKYKIARENHKSKTTIRHIKIHARNTREKKKQFMNIT